MLVLTAALPCAAAQDESPRTWSMGFWTGVTGQPISDLDWAGLTHIMHVAVEPDAGGSLTFTCGSGPCPQAQLGNEARRLIGAAHEHKVKVLLNVGHVAGSRYSGAIRTNLAGFAKNLLSIVNAYGYDGIDIDWEQDVNAAQLTSLVTALRPLLGARLLTIDVDGTNPALYAALQDHLDRVNAMTYDQTGDGMPYSWFNSALNSDPCDCVLSLDLVRKRLIAAGLAPGKLNMGIPFYGWISTGGGINGPRQTGAKVSLKQSNYDALAATYNLAGASFDPVSQSPWLAIPNGWVTFDNARSITAKVNYVKNHSLGGWIIWELEQDYLPKSAPKHPLLSAIAAAMAGSAGR